MTETQQAQSSKKAPVFQHLAGYIKFLLENKLEDFIRIQLKLSYEVEAPIMQYFNSIPEETLIQMSLEPTREFWNHIVTGNIEFQIQDAIEKWKANQLPMISRDQVVADDISKGNYVRKVTLLRILHDYTKDPELYTAISEEIEFYLQMLISASFKAYIEIQNEKLEQSSEILKKSEDQLLEAQKIANIGSFEWNLDGKGKSTISPQLYKIFELEQDTEFTDFLLYVHEDDREKLQNSIFEAMQNGGVCETEYRYNKGGIEKVIWSKGLLVYNDNVPAYMKGTVMDITERSKVMSELQERDNLYKQAQAITHIGNWSWNIVTGKVNWSDELFRIYGLEPHSREITLDTFISFVHPEDRDTRAQNIKKALESADSDNYTMRIVQPSGTVRVLRGHSQIIRVNGQPIQMLGTCQDITSEYTLLKRLEEENLFAETLINASEDVITGFDTKLNLIAINKKAEERYGVKRAEVLGKSVLEVFPYMAGTQTLEELKRGLQGERLFIPDSKSVVLETYYDKYIIPLKNTSGDVYAVLSVGRDITEIKTNTLKVTELSYSLEEKDEQLRRNREHYEKMIKEVQDYAIISLDINGNILNWNLGAEKIKGYRGEEIIGKSFKTFYSTEDQNNLVPDSLLNEAVTNGRATSEGWRLRKDGTKFWGSVVITTLHDNNNNIIGFSKVTRDLTERKKAEEQLKEANVLLTQLNYSLEQKNHQLERSNKELSAFSYVASHDLQEPIRKIKTFANLITETESDHLLPKDKQFLDRIIAASNSMQKLIEDLLAFSRTHNSDEQFETVDLNRLIASINTDMEIIDSGYFFKAENLPTINGIPFQLTQLFQNLIGNSIKYAKPDQKASITINSKKAKGIDYEKFGADKNLTYHVIEVADNGIGFEQKYAERIFEPFQRLHGKNEYSGTGIGLAICKKIALNHNGVMFAESEPGKGSSFYLLIPTTKV